VLERGEAAGWRERASDPAAGATCDAHAVPVALGDSATDIDGEPAATEKAVRSLAVNVALEVRPMHGEGAVPRSRQRGQPHPVPQPPQRGQRCSGLCFCVSCWRG